LRSIKCHWNRNTAVVSDPREAMPPVRESDAHWIVEVKTKMGHRQNFAAFDTLADDPVSVWATLTPNKVVVGAFGLPPIFKLGDANPNDPVLTAPLAFPLDRETRPQPRRPLTHDPI
jgi:hypothetical protein